MWLRRSRERCALWLFAGVLAACTQEPADEGSPETLSEAQAVAIERVDVTVREGTNLAAAADPATGNRVLSLQGQLFLIDGVSGAARPLTSPYYDAREPQFAPDGRSVVFQGYRHGTWDLFRVDLDGTGEPQRLTNDAFDDREPQLTADGAAVVFSSDRSGSYDIWRLDLSSGALEALTRTNQDAHSPAMSASGDLAYVARQGLGARIVLAAAEERVLASHAGTVAGLAFSPDGRALSYQVHTGAETALRVIDLQDEAGDAEARHVSVARTDVFPFRAQWLSGHELAYTADGLHWRHDLDTGAETVWPFSVTLPLERHRYERRLRDYAPDKLRRALGIAHPTISNDGQHVYFTALGDLWHWQPGAGSLTALTEDRFAEAAPALRPDGAALAYVSDRTGQVSLHVMDLATQDERVLAVQAQQISAPSWSPDGKRLAFFVDIPGNPLGGQLTIYDLETNETQAVLQPMPALPVSWTSDGQRVAVARLNPYARRYREGVYKLVVADIDGTAQHEIGPLPHRSIVDARLLPDGAMAYVQDARLHRLELDDNQQPVEGGVALTEGLTDMPGWSADGAHAVYLAGDRLMRWSQATGTSVDISPSLTYQLDSPDERYVLRAGRVFTGQGTGYLTNQDIVVDGARIVSVGPADAAVTPDVDASAHAVVPGFFEMHAHMGETSEPQGRVWLAYGVTTVRDPGSNPYVAKARQEAWDAGVRIGPRTHVTGYLTDGNRVFYSVAEGIATQAHLDLALARTAALQLDFIKTYVRLPDDMQKRAVTFAHEQGIPLSSHELYPAIAHGADHVEHIGGTSRRGYQPKVSALGYSYQDVVALLAEGGMGLTATAVLPGFAVIVAQEPDWFETPQFASFYGAPTRRAYEMMIPRFGPTAGAIAEANGRLLRALTERDALLVTGTDAPFVPYGAGLHAEFRLYARAGLSGAAILHQATMKSAEAAGVGNELGQVAEGFLADLVVVDGDPLADIRDADNIVMTIKNGKRYALTDLTTPGFLGAQRRTPVSMHEGGIGHAQ